MNLTQAQMDKVQIDEGVIYLNYGETNEVLLAPTRGGGEFSVKSAIRDIDYDGKKGKTKGLQVIDEQDATLKVTTIGASQSIIESAISGCGMDINIIKNGVGGVIPSTKYLKNVTMFCKTIDGKFKKITIFNALNESDFTLGAKPKAEGEITLEFIAHWNPLDTSEEIYQIEDVNSIGSV